MIDFLNRYETLVLKFIIVACVVVVLLDLVYWRP